MVEEGISQGLCLASVLLFASRSSCAVFGFRSHGIGSTMRMS